MDATSLTRCLWEDPFTRHQYGGVLAIDELPTTRLPRQKRIWVINSDERAGPGKHWLMVYFVPALASCEFFDSLGLSLDKYPPQLADFVFRNSATCVYNSRKLQCDTSSTCGYFCLYYGICRARGLNSNEIINSFSWDCTYNDSKVTTFFTNYF
jgi:hypothetical protein